MQSQKSYSFDSNLIRRVENFSLSSNVPKNSIIPLFEAIYNSLHSILDRYGDDLWIKNGLIKVSKFEDGGLCLSIVDNGDGFTEENFSSFKTYDSPRKKKIHGKGIGRIAWLKVFEEAEVKSVFTESGKNYVRSFKFVLDPTMPIQEHRIVEAKPGEPKETEIVLKRVRSEYKKHFPVRIETLTNRIIAHFNAYLLSGSAPEFIISDEADSLEIRDYVQRHRVDIGTSAFSYGESEIKIDHYLVEKSLSEGKVGHMLQFSGSGRIVYEKEVGAAFGLNTLIEQDGVKYFYTGIVRSEILDFSVNTERTFFDLDHSQLDEINRRCIENAAEILSPYIQRVISRQESLVVSVIKKYPRYSYLVKDAKEFVKDKLPRNMRTAESVYSQLSLYDFRENRKIERQLQDEAASDLAEEITGRVKELIIKVSDQEKAALAEYTAKRRIVIDILDKRLGYQPGGDMKNYSEEAVHALICPVRATNHDISIDDHNLWIIDDKLTYYNFWASDKKIKSYITSESDARPDVALFSGKTLFHRENSSQPIVIIEFKKPARNNYDYEENPIVQLYDYIEELRGGKVRDKDGIIIDDIEENHPFFCYVIADFTPNLKKYIRATQINLPLPGGVGYYGFNQDYNAYIQVLNWKYLVRDARLRNEAFFRHLKI